LKEVNAKTPIVSKIETAPKIQNMILDALDKDGKTNVANGKSCILDENGNLPEIQSE
jgi:hypothetical protein